MHRGILYPCIIFVGRNARFNNSLSVKIRRKYHVSSPVINIITQAVFVHKKYHIFYKTKRIILDCQGVPDGSLKKFTECGIGDTQYHTQYHTSKEK